MPARKRGLNLFGVWAILTASEVDKGSTTLLLCQFLEVFCFAPCRMGSLDAEKCKSRCFINSFKRKGMNGWRVRNAGKFSRWVRIIVIDCYLQFLRKYAFFLPQQLAKPLLSVSKQKIKNNPYQQFLRKYAFLFCKDG